MSQGLPICRRPRSHRHLLALKINESGAYDVDPSIVAAASPQRLFTADLVRFTEEAADRLKADHDSFREDLSLGAFDSIDMVYR